MEIACDVDEAVKQMYSMREQQEHEVNLGFCFPRG